jgi:uncharacterized protein (DUF2384 family)
MALKIHDSGDHSLAKERPNHARVLSQAVVEVAERLALGATDLKPILGISQPTASRLLNGKYLIPNQSKTWEIAAHFVRLYRALYSLVGGDDNLARSWLKTPNQAFDGRTPLAVIARVDGLLDACDYVDAHRARV